MRAIVLCGFLILSACLSTHGKPSPALTAGVVGGALIVGGAATAAGRCPDDGPCDEVERGSNAAAMGMVLAGAALLGLAYLFDRAEHPR